MAMAVDGHGRQKGDGRHRLVLEARFSPDRPHQQRTVAGLRQQVVTVLLGRPVLA
ncbi:MAG: hypothetical protein R2854_15790 [Caldilineaceae bacterium]